MGHLEPEGSRLGRIPEIKWLVATIMEKALTRGEYLMAGGVRSDYYIDKFRLFSDPGILRRIARLFAPIVADINPDLIAGTELGGVILATAVSQMSNIPMIVVRKAPKAYGAFSDEYVEGPYREGQRVLRATDVGSSDHAGLAVRPGLRRDPGQQVGAVRAVVAQRTPAPLRAIAAAHVLDHDRIAVGDEVGMQRRGGSEILAIGRARHDRREPPGRLDAVAAGQKDVGRQPHAVARLDHQVTLRDGGERSFVHGANRRNEGSRNGSPWRRRWWKPLTTGPARPGRSASGGAGIR